MTLTKTEETITATHEAKINPNNFSTSGGKISQLNIVLAMAIIEPTVIKKRRKTAKEAVKDSIFLLSIQKL